MRWLNNISIVYLFIIITSLIILVFLSGCKKILVGPPVSQVSFPEFYLEKGSDIDSSFISFRGIRITYDTLEIQATGWGIIETGLHLHRGNIPLGIFYMFTGYCGTITSKTWAKVTLTDWITASETDTLWVLGFTNFRDTLTIAKATTH